MQITAAVSRSSLAAPRLETLELEAPRAGEMLVRIVAVGICHTDLHEHPGRHSPQPIVLGHEGAGVVEALGEGCAALRSAIMSSSAAPPAASARAASPGARPIATSPCR